MERHIKQITIGTIYFVIFAVLIALVSWMFIFTGVECADCPSANQAPLETIDKLFANTNLGTYDLVARIRNPNPSDEAHVAYAIVIKDTAGQEHELFSGKAIMFPNQTQYLIAPGVRLPSQANEDLIKNFYVSFKNLTWKPHRGNLPILGTLETAYQRTEDSRGAFGILTGSLVNNTSEAYDSVKVIALLYNEHEELTTASFTMLKNVGARAKQSFTITWSNPAFGTPTRIVVEAYPQ